MKIRISKSQVLNLLAIAGGVAASIYAYTAPGGAVHLPAALAWVPGVAAAIAGLSRSVVPKLSGVPGQDPLATLGKQAIALGVSPPATAGAAEVIRQVEPFGQGKV